MNVEDLTGAIDFGIITIREDEFEAVLDRLPRFGSTAGRRWYNFGRLQLPNGGEYLAAIVRCTEQGTGEAQAVANDLIEELHPRWLLVVGIAGGIPADEFSLGDVVVSTRIHDLSVESTLQGGEREFALMGGPIHRAAAIIVANLAAMKQVLHGWNDPASLGIERPCVEITSNSLYGDTAWKDKVRQSLERHRTRTVPLVVSGAIASSDRLIKDVDLLRGWQKMVRQVLAVEMEAAGVYRAAQGTQTPILAIRGISDVIGFRRDSAWTRYACHSAASFMRAFLLAQPIEPRQPGSDLISSDQAPPTYKVEELILILEDRALMIRRRLAERYGCESVKHFVARFDHLHGEHIKSLRSGMLVRAHELVREIHEMSFEKILQEDGNICYIEHPEPAFEYLTPPPPPPPTVQSENNPLSLDYLPEFNAGVEPPTQRLRRFRPQKRGQPQSVNWGMDASARVIESNEAARYSLALEQIASDKNRAAQVASRLKQDATRMEERRRELEIERYRRAFAENQLRCPHCHESGKDIRILVRPSYYIYICPLCGRSFREPEPPA